MGKRRSGMPSRLVVSALAIGLVASSGLGCSLHESLLHRGTKAPARFGEQPQEGYGLSPTLGTDFSKLKPGQSGPDPVPGSDLQ